MKGLGTLSDTAQLLATIQTVLVSQQVNAGLGEQYGDAKMRSMRKYDAGISPHRTDIRVMLIFVCSLVSLRSSSMSWLLPLQKEQAYCLPCACVPAVPTD
jgi:hypothetical protein